MNSYMSNVKGNDIKVAIKCLVYNHEPYLRDCLEGFVMQQTDFPFVAIVHDDASTDHSADIIREYAAKYPDIIHPIYETENQYSKKGSLTKIMNDAIEATGAPYIARLLDRPAQTPKTSRLLGNPSECWTMLYGL